MDNEWAIPWEIPYRFLKPIEMLFFILFPVLSLISLIMGIEYNLTVFYVASVLSFLYEIILLLWIRNILIYECAFILNIVSVSAIGALNLIGFGFYVIGSIILAYVGGLVLLLGCQQRVQEGALRIFARATNGQAHHNE